MADQSISVTPGIVTTLNVRLANGATIQNLDAANAVWVSSNPAVAPGYGSRIGPKGSLQWTTDGAPCYAVTDTGVVAAVMITVSTDISTPVNPVDIGIAVATQLLLQGIPSVYLGKTIGQGGNMPVITPGVQYGYQQVDVSQYASMTAGLQLQSTGTINVNFTDLNNNNVGSWSFPVTKTGGVFTFSVPIRGPRMNITVVSASNTGLFSVNVSNRNVSGLTIPVSSINPPSYNLNQAFTAGTPVDFGGLPYVSGGGQTYIRAQMTGTGKGLFGFRAFDSNAAPATYDFLDSSFGRTPSWGAATEIETGLILPAGQLQLYFNPQISATFAAGIMLVQST